MTIARDRRHAIGQDDSLNVERNRLIRIGKDRSEEVGNDRYDKTTASHFIETGGHVEHSVQGHHQLEAGQSIERRTSRYDLQAGECVVITSPGGAIVINDAGITLEGSSILLKGPVSRENGGSGNPFSIAGDPDEGSESDFCVTCFLRAARNGGMVVPV
ncbi:hypothetical protein PSEWESI4_02548 [Pseudomonas carbonaria]|uniref:Type VI secretion system secreted protein VgrG n=1 Tax=Zestomonas carbonaria TaxID=2762745 RepID=A0A7U7ENI4_9GAMM|nr:hypothetical protein PSEWESI4_02548 [Pseudomonas carbonaria]